MDSRCRSEKERQGERDRDIERDRTQERERPGERLSESERERERENTERERERTVKRKRKRLLRTNNAISANVSNFEEFVWPNCQPKFGTKPPSQTFFVEAFWLYLYGQARSIALLQHTTTRMPRSKTHTTRLLTS